MKKARIMLSSVVLLTVASISFAVKIAKRSPLNYYTTNVRNAICTKTLTHATTTVMGTPKYYTFIKGRNCTLYATLTKNDM